MIHVFRKEVKAFFSSLIGYLVIGIFLLMTGLMVWVFPDYSILNYNFATLDPFFNLAPMVFLFLIPALTMRSLAEENQSGTIEWLMTKPLKIHQVVLGKYFATTFLVLFAILPSVIYYYSIYQLGSPKGNLDSGAIFGSYFGLFLLGASFSAIGIFASSLTKNQITAFIVGAFLCFTFYWAFYYVSKLPIFVGTWDALIQKMGIDYHYASISRGVIDSRDLLYFASVIFIFLFMTTNLMSRRR